MSIWLFKKVVYNVDVRGYLIFHDFVIGHLTSDTKDKFLVMLLTLKDDISENNPECLNALWKKVSKDSEDYMEHRCYSLDYYFRFVRL